MSHFLSLQPFVTLIWVYRENMWTLLSRSPLLIEIPATVVQAPPPLGPDVHPEEESTHLEQCPPKLVSHGAWETGMFPSPHSGAQGLHPWDSFHHSLCAIHKQALAPPSSLPYTQTLTHKHTLPSFPPAAHPYLYFPSFITLTFWSNVSLGAEPTACWTDCLSNLSLLV